MRQRLVAVIAVLLMGLGASAVSQETLAVSVTIQVIASDPDVTSRGLADWADESGGYFTSRSEQQVILRIPPERVPDLRARIEAAGDTIVLYNPSAVDYREELSRNNAAISSRDEALDRILSYMDDANVVATLNFERELRTLLEEIEYYTGRNRRIASEITFATVTVNLSSRQRTIPEQRPSTFVWVNTIDLYRFLEEARP